MPAVTETIEAVQSSPNPATMGRRDDIEMEFAPKCLIETSSVSHAK